MFSLRLADTSGNFAKRRSLSDEGRLPDQWMPHAIPGVWNLSGGVQEQMDRVYSFNMVGWDGYSMKRFPIRSSLSHNSSRWDTPTAATPPSPSIHNFTGSREQTPLPFENIHTELWALNTNLQLATHTVACSSNPWYQLQASKLNILHLHIFFLRLVKWSNSLAVGAMLKIDKI